MCKESAQDERLVLSVIVLNFNGLKFLSECLDSLYKFVDVPFEIVFVDNQSSDESVEFVESNYSSVKVVISPENGGFSKGNNLGVSNAIGQYLLILNNDTILQSPVSGGINILEESSAVGVVGAKMLSPNGAYRRSAGYFPGVIGAIFLAGNLVSSHPFARGDFSKKSGSYHTVDWVEASFSIVRRCDFLSAGGYNEGHFMYAEDLDFCYRLGQQGLKTVYAPELEYIHFGGFNIERYGMLVHGYRDFFKDNYNPMHASVCILALFLGLCVKIVGFRLLHAFQLKSDAEKRWIPYLKGLKAIRGYGDTD